MAQNFNTWQVVERTEHQCPNIAECSGYMFLMGRNDEFFLQCSSYKKECRGSVKLAQYPGVCECFSPIVENNIIVKHRVSSFHEISYSYLILLNITDHTQVGSYLLHRMHAKKPQRVLRLVP